MRSKAPLRAVLADQYVLLTPVFVLPSVLLAAHCSCLEEDLGGSVDGVLQNYRVFAVVVLLPVPNHLSYEEAAALPGTGATVWNALFSEKPLVPGETVLFQGTGGVSMTGLMVATVAGAKVSMHNYYLLKRHAFNLR